MASETKAASTKLETLKEKKIIIRGASEHNLKSIDLEIPKEKLIVVTGVSGSGKSSLVFDTIFAEGQRRYVESLSAYARQFLGLVEKPHVDYIEGLSPAISIDQKTAGRNPRSTVGTITEIYDYLRLLFARVGIPHCPYCGKEIKPQTSQQIVDNVLRLGEGKRIIILAPVIKERKGEYRKEFKIWRSEGYSKVRVDGEIRDLSDEIVLDRYKIHTIELVIDRLVISNEERERLTDSIEKALELGDGVVRIVEKDGREYTFSEHFACIDCGFSFQELEPRLFSFNTPHGACPKCMGLGYISDFDVKLIIPDENLSIAEGAIKPFNWFSNSNWIKAVAKKYGFTIYQPWKTLTEEQKRAILYGTGNTIVESEWIYHGKDGVTQWEGITKGTYPGIINILKENYKNTTSEEIRKKLEQYMIKTVCPECHGTRLKPESRSVKFKGKTIAELTQYQISDLIEFFENIELTEKEQKIATEIIKEILARLGFLKEVGLDYLTLDRAANTLSGGESQRIRLASQIGSRLVGVIYCLDEPSIGLHPRDNKRLLNSLKELRDLGNTVIVVEHDEETMRNADWIIDLGPHAGESGGKVVAQGTINDILQTNTLTAKYLKGELKIDIPKKRRKPNGKWLEIIGARHNNLKNINVKIPLGVFTCITGVSGSGKSSLINDTLQRALARKFHHANLKPGEHERIEGVEYLDKVIIIDQSPIGRTPRSNPATYTKVFDHIRELYASLPEAKARGYKKGRFSFNVKGGRCEKCKGAGVETIEMHFLPPVQVICDLCHGKRYNESTLEVKYKGKSIADVLDMTIQQAYEFFKDIPQIQRKLKTLIDVGMGYVKLGQPATTLSGGEAQRIKLSKYLSRPATGQTLFLLDEPTTGLHFDDVKHLLEVLHRLVELGNTVVVIEHNLDVVKTADYIIDLGPEGGDAGGYIVAAGTPEEIAESEVSYTGQFLRNILRGEQ